MKIGIDIRALQWDHKYRGIGVYLSSLLESLSEIDHTNKYIFFGWKISNPLNHLHLTRGFKYEYIQLHTPSKKIIAQKIGNILKRSIDLSNTDIDVFLQPEAGFGLPKGSAPTVSVVYDLVETIFQDQHYPNSFTKLIQREGIKHALGSKVRLKLYQWHLQQLNKSSELIAISATTKHDFLELFPAYQAAKITVVPLAASRKFHPIQVPREPANILYVGAADYRKNLVSLVEAFTKVKKTIPQAELNLVGRAFEADGKKLPEHEPLWRAINSSAAKMAIHTHDFVKSDKLVAMYQRATVFTFPSIYEGFGMPVLEAMACGTPVISYNTSSIPEVAGNAALLVKPGEDLSQPMLKLLSSKELQQVLSRRGLAQAKKFSWEQTARQTLAVLEKAAKA